MTQVLTQSGWLRRVVLALFALALSLAPIHGHGPQGGDFGERVILSLDVYDHSPEPTPDHPDQKSGQCSACLTFKQFAMPAHTSSLTMSAVVGLLWWPARISGDVAESSANLFRPPIRVGV